jgi:uncharacterized protein (DUF488 family)
MDSTPVATIGFTKSTAERFFERLLAANVKRVIDVRLHNTSQLAGFAKADDLAYLLGKVGGIGYAHEPLLAPTDAMLKAYRKEKGDWGEYRANFLDLMAERKIEERLKLDVLAGACLLCSEATPDHCHRLLVCEYLNGKWGGRLTVRHL